MGFDLENLIEMYDYCNVIRDCYYEVDKSKSIDDLKKVYSKVKNMSHLFYDGSLKSSYDIVKKYMEYSELIFDRDYLIDPTFRLKDYTIDNCSSAQDVLNYLVNEGRKYILVNRMHYSSSYACSKDWNINMSNYCRIASEKIKELCDNLGIVCRVVEIYPGYDEIRMLFDGCGYHFFNVIELNNKRFLIDITYSQFFKLSNTNIERIGLMNYHLPKAGAFMLMKEDSLEIAQKIVKDGYIELNEEVFKAYMDAFTISFRNGLYYEETNDYSYTTSYTVKDYENFLTGQDSQVRHEGADNLGYQKRPIRNI